MSKLTQANKRYRSLLYILLCIGLQFNIIGQDDIPNQEIVDHVDVFFYQNNQIVNCLDHTQPLFILFINNHPERNFYVSFSGPDGEQMGTHPLADYDYETGVGNMYFEAYYFDHKSPLNADGVSWLISEIYPNGQQLHNSITLPLCLYDSLQNIESESRQFQSNAPSRFYIFNSSGQMVKEIAEFDANIFSLDFGLVPGLYFVLENKNNKVEFLCHYFQN